ncbi:unnamed protein product [Vitrella brassicaformis CCMP3155]|uniref:Uncharacterized protein n=1 Tax=Vitrella brassicaformis (strain CCMP3155) TaxID=1169540 RepID=A0A0G4F8B4_VITBC|nr:unnamed protein product [Vitrella brassicaformis CCMP3155]|mmetsp:Transcript_5259/g.12406  ORF Transcript_5259/g.12406 Transcript_5259/m.12406 type:complete len:310 (-) Transcript_5259:298-1227(-)|eukprot:CEM08957.1 unnamed protein product [Vitrella brassicaformis CCMP3155]
MEGPSVAEQCFGCSKVACRVCVTTLKFLTSFNMKLYFFWSAIIYIGAATFAYIMRDRIMFLPCPDAAIEANACPEYCNDVPPQYKRRLADSDPFSSPPATPRQLWPLADPSRGPRLRSLQRDNSTIGSDFSSFLAGFAGGPGNSTDAQAAVANRREKCKQTDCNVDVNLALLLSTYYIQGCIALIVSASFAYFDTKDEDKMGQLSCIESVMGCLCKKVPQSVRLLSIVNLIQLALLTCQTFIKEWEPQCGENDNLKNTIYAMSAVWLFQLVLGVMAKQTLRPPPWMFVPQRRGKGFVYAFGRFMRALGP